MKKVHTWVSCNDRLPKIGKWVLAYTIFDTITVSPVVIGKINSIKETEDMRVIEWVTDDYVPFWPTHWMLLPTPPRVKKQKTDDK